MKKKLLAILISILAVCMSAFLFTACGDNPTDPPLSEQGSEQQGGGDDDQTTDASVFIVEGDTIAGLTDYGKTLTEIVIPAKMNGVIIRSIGVRAFEGCDNFRIVTFEENSQLKRISSYAFTECVSLESIEIPDSVTWINWDVFDGCDNLQYTVEANLRYLGNNNNKYLYLVDTISNDLTSVIINSNCKIIGNGVFRYCYSLESIKIPDNVIRIGIQTFENCKQLKNIEIPSGITSIDVSAFKGCDNLQYNLDGDLKYLGNNYNKYIALIDTNLSNMTSATINAACKIIGSDAFTNCSLLTSIEIPSSVISIGENAFENCSSLKNIKIPSSVISIGEDAFENCSSLKNIEIPSSVIDIDLGAFYNCSSLENITVDEKNTVYQSINGNLYNKNGTILMQYAIGKTQTSFIIPDSVTCIGYYAFSYGHSLKNIEIPNRIISISSYAFRNCDSLISIEIPNSVTILGRYVFDGCIKLQTIKFGDNSQLTSIGTSAFDGCKALKSIEIPNSVTSIGNNAFYNCDQLTSIEISNSVTSIGDYAFRGCNSLQNITFEENSQLRSIGVYAFYDCSSLTSIEIGNSVECIGDRAFAYCNQLTIYCEATSKPSGWSSRWNYSNRPVVWDCKNSNN